MPRQSLDDLLRGAGHHGGNGKCPILYNGPLFACTNGQNARLRWIDDHENSLTPNITGWKWKTRHPGILLILIFRLWRERGLSSQRKFPQDLFGHIFHDRRERPPSCHGNCCVNILKWRMAVSVSLHCCWYLFQGQGDRTDNEIINGNPVAPSPSGARPFKSRRSSISFDLNLNGEIEVWHLLFRIL